MPLDGDGGERPPRQLTLGAKHDGHARFSPDGRTLAFLSDRRHLVEEEPDAGDTKEREDGSQVHLLSLDGGEARRLTDLPRGVDGFEWSPDGRQLVVVSTLAPARTARTTGRLAASTTKREPSDPPESDYRYIDRLGYMFNGPGFIYDHVAQLWIVDVETGEATRLTDGAGRRRRPGLVARRHAHRLLDAASIATTTSSSGRTSSSSTSRPASATRITGGPEPTFFVPAWLPDGSTIAALGGRLPANGYRNDIWLFAADGSEATPGGGTNLSDRHDLMPGSAMNSDITPGEGVAADPVGRRPLAVVPRAARRRVPAVADRGRGRLARAADRGPPLPLGVRPGRRPRRSRRAPPSSARRRRSWPTSGSATAPGRISVG